MSLDKKRCGFAAVIGLPNAGKSTLMNAVVGAKVSIVSKKAQTTRCRVRGIAIHENAQIILIDTPGIFEPQKTLDKAMVKAAWESIDEADVILHIIDAGTKNPFNNNQKIIERLPKDIPVFLVFNKTDKINKPELLTLATNFNEAFPYAATYMISALAGQGVPDIVTAVTKLMPEGEWHFDEDQIADMPLRLMAAEITREKVFHQLHAELPYAVLVETENWENFRNGDIKIDQAIYVKRDSQKAIVLGKGGAQIKKIGEASRKDLEELTGTRVHLKLFVKVQENWEERAENYSLMGLDFSK
jgi:GTP-binding protein Era